MLKLRSRIQIQYFCFSYYECRGRTIVCLHKIRLEVLKFLNLYDEYFTHGRARVPLLKINYILCNYKILLDFILNYFISLQLFLRNDCIYTERSDYNYLTFIKVIFKIKINLDALPNSKKLKMGTK